MEEGREDKEEEIGRGDPAFQSEVRPNNESIYYSEKSPWRLHHTACVAPSGPPRPLGGNCFPCPRFTDTED